MTDDFSDNTSRVNPTQERQPSATPNPQGKWEQRTLEKMLFSSVREQRRTRRWGIFFKSLLFIYLFGMFWVFYPPKPDAKIVPHTALVKVEGIIEDSQDSNANNIIRGLRSAFESGEAQAILLQINSPGGTPVQAAYVYDEILRLRALHPDKPVYAVCTDICASGAYYIAAAADEIYANPSSIVGSIGVLMNGFGFTGAMEKVGVERRLLVAGDNKSFLDPFSPLNPAGEAHAQLLIDDIHNQFISAVQDGRGDRLGDDPELFSGLVWTGHSAVGLGLIDGLGSPGYVVRELIGEEKVIDYTPRTNIFDRFANRIGASFANRLNMQAWQLK